jgi:hypothetical protein
MIKSMNSDIGKRINVFDGYEQQTVETFNQLFTECPLKGQPDDEVTIGLPDTGNTRKIFINGNPIKHKMFSDVLYGMDRAEFLLDERDKELDDIMGHPV